MNDSQLRCREIRVRAVAAPMKRPLATAGGALTQAALILLDLQTPAGITGRSYLFPIGQHNVKPIVGLLEAMAEMLRGDAVAPLEIERKLCERYALLGVHNIVLFAMSGIDMAAWDVLGQARQQPITRLLGGAARAVPAYNSNGLGLMPIKPLVKEAVQLLKEGFSALKLRLGRPRAKDDIAALRAVRREIGPQATLMVDFNQCLSVAEAIRRGRMIDDEGGVLWIEEPVRADDFAGCAKVAREVATPIQIGENFMGAEQMAQALMLGACDYVMPDAQRIGGVTGWMRAAALAKAAGIEMSSHLFPEISAQLLAVTPTGHYLEYVDWAAPILDRPLEIRNGCVRGSDAPGCGIAWNESAVRRYAL